MYLSSVIILLYINFAYANWYKPLPGHRSDVGHGGFVARQVEGGSNCTEETSCSECFGQGYVLCNNAGCFDPSQGQQCCKDGSYCVGPNNSCCGDTGPGSTGTDGVIPQSAYSAFYSATTQWQCFPTDTNKECCTRGGNNIQWCSGDYPDQICYNASVAQCCSNGEPCTGQGCCKSMSAVAITPNPTQATETGTPTPTNQPSNSHNTTPPPTSASTATAATPVTTNSKNAGSGLEAMKGIMGLLGAFLTGLIFL